MRTMEIYCVSEVSFIIIQCKINVLLMIHVTKRLYKDSLKVIYKHCAYKYSIIIICFVFVNLLLFIVIQVFIIFHSHFKIAIYLKIVIFLNICYNQYTNKIRIIINCMNKMINNKLRTLTLALRYSILLLSKKLLTSQSYQKTELCKYFSRYYYILQMYTTNPRFYKHESAKLIFYKMLFFMPYYNYISMLINHDIYSDNPYSTKLIHIIVYYHLISYLPKPNMYFPNPVITRIKKLCIFKTYLSDKQVPYDLPSLFFSQMLVISSAISSSPSLYLRIIYHFSSSYPNIYVLTLLDVKIITYYIHKNKSFITAYIRIIMYSNMLSSKELLQFLDLKCKIIYINCKNLQINKTICMVQFSRLNEHKELNAR